MVNEPVVLYLACRSRREDFESSRFFLASVVYFRRVPSHECRMYIETLTVKNFRCFQEQVFQLEPDLVVLFGENGLGKTAVLDAIAIAAGTLSLVFDTMLGQEIDHQDVLARYKNPGESQRLTRELDYPSSVTASGYVFGQPLSWKRELTGPTSKFCTYTEAGDLKQVAELAKRKLTDAADPLGSSELPLLAYYRNSMYWSGFYEEPSFKQEKGPNGERPPLKGYRFHEKNRARVAERMSWSMTGAYSRLDGYREALNSSANLDQIRAWWRESRLLELDQLDKGYRSSLGALTAVKTAVQRALDLPNFPFFDLELLDIVLEIKDQGIHPLWELSDGYRHVVSMVSDIARRLSILNPHLNERVCEQGQGIVLIDEIGQHLHPKWQQRILPDLRRAFPRLQFIVSTHSDQVLTSVEQKHIIGLFQHNGQIVPENPNISTKGATSERVARSLMEVEPRPDNAEAKALADYRTLVDAGEGFTQRAMELRAQLEVSLADDPELALLDFERERQRHVSRAAQERQS